jgi:hypothetical protein
MCVTCMHVGLYALRIIQYGTGQSTVLYTLRGTGKVSRIDTVSVASVRVMDGEHLTDNYFPSLLSN